MAVRKANAIWKGTLKEGSGTMKVGSGAFEVAFSFATRFEEEPGTNPEELIGAAQAGCFSMFLAAQLTNAGHPPKQVQTEASVNFGRDDQGPLITSIELDCKAEVPGVDEATFNALVDKSKKLCPISRALAATELKVTARLV
jgi:osmotically inducible protein OsmC